MYSMVVNKSRKRSVLVLGFVHILKAVQLQQLKEMQSCKLGM